MSNYEIYPKPGSEEMRKQFRQSDDVVMLNHGAYGLAPNEVLEHRIRLIREQEDLPDIWFRVNYDKYYEETIKCAADFVGADVDDIFVVDNATTGTNTVLKSLPLQAKDEILLTTHTYMAVQNTIDELKHTRGICPRFMEMPIPIDSENDIVDMYEKVLSEHSNIKLAIVDHITSPSAILMPLNKILDVFERHKVMVFVDGAHAPGQVKLNMNKLNADFYAGNFHKWGYTARSCAFLWINKKHKGKVLPLVTSNCYRETMHQRFSYLGTRDTSNHFTLPKAIEFHNGIGGLDAIQQYANDMFQWAIPMLCDALGTKPLDIPETMQAPYMRVIGLPEMPQELRKLDGNEVICEFWKRYSIIAGFLEFNNRCWLRLGFNVYNNKHDVVKLLKALLDFFQIKKSGFEIEN